MFYCRENELSKLQKRYDENKFEFAVIYGRRRVGKTALINEFCKGKPTIFFSALNGTSKENLTALSRAIYEYKSPDSNNADAPIYQDFDAAFAAITKLCETKRLIFVIDEYPYLASSEPSVSSRLQHIIDHAWSTGKLFLILCGSSMSFMEYQVLGYESPLYGRRTAQFKIQALTYKEIQVFHPSLSLENQALLYGITGGIPHYINKLAVRESIDEALIENLFDTSSYLFEEPGNLLKQELREPAIYNSIISAIAGGASKMNEIATKSGIETAICAKYLKVLLDLSIVKKEIPITEKTTRKTIYLLGDNFFRFWYRFVPINMTAIISGRIKNSYQSKVKRYFSDYMGLIFEQMCKDYLLYYADDLPITLSDIGQWWGTDKVTKREVQIDIVGSSSDDSEYLIGSCKYKSEKIGIDELELLKRYATIFGKGTQYHFYIFSKSGFTDGLRELGTKGKVTLLTLEDIYK